MDHAHCVSCSVTLRVLLLCLNLRDRGVPIYRYADTDIRRGYVLRNASLGDFVVVRTCTYTNLDSTV